MQEYGQSSPSSPTKLSIVDFHMDLGVFSTSNIFSFNYPLINFFNFRFKIMVILYIPCGYC
jgi:hypothetical protein